MRLQLSLILLSSAAMFAQSFNSGSTGVDGPLNLTTPGTITFDPGTISGHHTGDSTFNFTTINIGSGVTVKLSSQLINGPVFWLAQGAVTIAGVVDLSGDAGGPSSEVPSGRVPNYAGAGGYSGGLSGNQATTNPTAGNGPGGGKGAVSGAGKVGATFTANQFLVPLIGGSGGGGGVGNYTPTLYGCGGGAGGGALLIASSTATSLTGTITANGGSACPTSNSAGGGGGGGSIRLAASLISGQGTLSVLGGNQGSAFPGDNGVIRLEAFQNTYTGTLSGPMFFATPFGVFLPPNPPPVLRVVSVGGSPVSQPPSDTFTVPDVNVNSSAPLAVVIQGQNIPIGTVVTLFITSENGPDQTLLSTALAGSVQNSTATASVTLPSGFSRGFVTATWTQ